MYRIIIIIIIFVFSYHFDTVAIELWYVRWRQRLEGHMNSTHRCLKFVIYIINMSFSLTDLLSSGTLLWYFVWLTYGLPDCHHWELLVDDWYFTLDIKYRTSYWKFKCRIMMIHNRFMKMYRTWMSSAGSAWTRGPECGSRWCGWRCSPPTPARRAAASCAAAASSSPSAPPKRTTAAARCSRPSTPSWGYNPQSLSLNGKLIKMSSFFSNIK